MRNNPLVFTDPSGHSWLSKMWKKIKTVVIAVVVVILAIYTGGLAFSALGYGSLAAATSAGALGSLMIAGAVGGFVGGFAGGLLNGASIGDAFKMGLTGALTGAVTAGLLYGASSTTSQLFKVDIKLSVTKLMKAGANKAAAFKAIANGLSRALISKLQGGSFKRTFLMSVESSSLRALYAKSVKYQTDANLKLGKGLAVNRKGYIGVYDVKEGDKIPFDKNIFGNNDTTSMMRQGSFISNVGNAFPGGAAISRVHDAWLHPFYTNITENAFTNIGLILPAAAVSYQYLSQNSQ